MTPTSRRLWYGALALILAACVYQAGWRQGRDSTPTTPPPITSITCDGTGQDSWCVVDGVADDGSEWLFDERPDGTIYGTYQTPTAGETQ